MNMPNTPVIALVGRPNVGKSTLFNRLTRTQDALVADYPGLTRDRNYGDVLFDNKPFIVIDTGGVGVDDRAVDALMLQQSEQAIAEADIVFLVTDARAGLTPTDEQIARHLRKLSKKTYLVVNKSEGLDIPVVSAEFQRLGFVDVFSVSAAHGQGMHALLAHATQSFAPHEKTALDNHAMKIAFVGRPNVGKSTLINRMLGEERVVVYDMPGTTRDSIAIPFQRDNDEYILIDTAGVRRRARVNEKIETFSVIKTLQSIKESDVCLMMLDATEGITEQDLHLLGFIIETGKALVILINKWDGLTEDQKAHVHATLDRRLTFISFAKIRFISALHGSGVGLLFRDIKQAYDAANQSFSTPQLTRLLQNFVTQHSPPLVQGRRIKLRYAHMGGHRPPVIVIHGNQVTALPDSYKRYLMNAFTEALTLVGTPLKLEFKSGDNPYKNKKNQLTPRQVRHKQRLLKQVKRKK